MALIELWRTHTTTTYPYLNSLYTHSQIHPHTHCRTQTQDHTSAASKATRSSSSDNPHHSFEGRNMGGEFTLQDNTPAINGTSHTPTPRKHTLTPQTHTHTRFTHTRDCYTSTHSRTWRYTHKHYIRLLNYTTPTTIHTINSRPKPNRPSNSTNNSGHTTQHTKPQISSKNSWRTHFEHTHRRYIYIQQRIHVHDAHTPGSHLHRQGREIER